MLRNLVLACVVCEQRRILQKRCMEDMEGDGTSVFQPQQLGIRGLRELVMLEALHVMCCYWIMGVDGRALGEVLDIGRERLDIVPAGDGESETYFPSDLPVFPNSTSLNTLRILLQVIILFELHGCRKKRATIKTSR